MSSVWILLQVTLVVYRICGKFVDLCK